MCPSAAASSENTSPQRDLATTRGRKTRCDRDSVGDRKAD